MKLPAQLISRGCRHGCNRLAKPSARVQTDRLLDLYSGMDVDSSGPCNFTSARMCEEIARAARLLPTACVRSGLYVGHDATTINANTLG